MSLRSRIIIGVLIAANLLLAGYISIVRSRQPVAAAAPKTTSPKLLPKVQLFDDRGQTLQSEQFLGMPLFVQFVNPDIRPQTDVVAAILKDRPKQPVKILLLTPNAQALRTRVPSITDDVTIVEKNYKDLRTVFEIPECCEMTVIFDKSGTRVDHRFYYQGGALAKLQAVVDGRPTFSPVLLKEAIDTVKTGPLEEVRQRTLTSSSGKAVIGLFSLVGTFCPSGELVDSLQRHQARLQNVEFLILFPKGYTANDARNLRANLKITIPITFADSDLSNVWQHFNFRYGESQINGSLLAIDRGKVLALQGVDELDSFLANARDTNAKP